LTQTIFGIRHRKKQFPVQRPRIPSISDLKNEFLVQNSLMRIKESNQEKSRYEMNPSKYFILNQDLDVPDRKANNYISQHEDYYPNINKDERALQREESLRNALRGRRDHNPKVYSADPNPYYGRDRPKRFRSDLLKDVIPVDIDLADLSYTFPSSKNLRKLEAELERLTNESKQTAYGKKLSDTDESYYDPTRQGREERIQILKKRIAAMDYELSHNFKPELSFEKENIDPQIQNPKNYDREKTNQFVTDSYFYPVNKNKLANGIIEDKALTKHGLMEKSKYVDSDKKIEATADSIGEILGNKYVKDDVKKTQSSEVRDNVQQLKREDHYYIDDGNLTFRNGAQTEKMKDKNGKDCDKEKFIDAKKVILNALGRETIKREKLMARKSENESNNVENTNKPQEVSNQNNNTNNNSPSKAEASSTVKPIEINKETTPILTQNTPSVSQNVEKNQNQSPAVENKQLKNVESTPVTNKAN